MFWKILRGGSLLPQIGISQSGTFYEWGKGWKNKLTSSADAIAISEIWNYHWPTDRGVGARRCYHISKRTTKMMMIITALGGGSLIAAHYRKCDWYENWRHRSSYLSIFLSFYLSILVCTLFRFGCPEQSGDLTRYNPHNKSVKKYKPIPLLRCRKLKVEQSLIDQASSYLQIFLSACPALIFSAFHLCTDFHISMFPPFGRAAPGQGTSSSGENVKTR